MRLLQRSTAHETFVQELNRSKDQFEASCYNTRRATEQQQRCTEQKLHHEENGTSAKRQ
jgi:hypothetical protein